MHIYFSVIDKHRPYLAEVLKYFQKTVFFATQNYKNNEKFIFFQFPVHKLYLTTFTTCIVECGAVSVMI